MEIHGSGSSRRGRALEVGERNDPSTQRRTDCLAPVACTQLLEDVAQVTFDGRRSQAKVFCQSLGRVAFRDPT